ncbi:hypothetical protein OG338_09605 [Streptomyces sp. NBC_00726]|uniref:hypothetical protein n=1 Tax=Streptomyces sp. NBC_00726 TaxID=2903674 RepID=UPI00386540C0
MALSGSTSASAAPYNQDLINKTDGSRLALYVDGTGEGAPAVTLRDPAYYSKYRTEAWDAEQSIVDGAVHITLRNRAANKCLQPALNEPTRGSGIVVKTCNGSALQSWVRQAEMVGNHNTGWWVWRPVTNPDLAMTLHRHNDGAWASLYLDTSYPSADRLWKLAPNDQAW